jgi:hypothetical protein
VLDQEEIVPEKLTVFPRRADTMKGVAAVAVSAVVAGSPLQAHAVDGCLVLLCLAAPSWRAIPQCVPPVTQVFRDLARGRPFPTCAMSGAGNSASHHWASAPANCPPQYTSAIDLESGTAYGCAFDGAVSVTVDGTPWSRTWWSLRGETVTDFSPAAKTTMGSWDSRFDDDLARWQASLPPPQPLVDAP